MTDIKPGMMVRWKDWRTVKWRPMGLVFNIHDPAIHEWTPFATPSATVMWVGRTELEHIFLRFIEPATDELDA